MDLTGTRDTILGLDVLIVDDAVTIREQMRALLQGSKVPAGQIREAENARAALEAFEQAPPDLVFIELVLPDIPGDEIGCVLMDKHPGTRFVPVTALDRRDRRVRRVISKGAAGVLEKPIQRNDLDTLLSSFRNQGGTDQASLREPRAV